jgi:hypothetical protein
MKLFEKGPPFGWQPAIGESVYLLVGDQQTILKGTIQGSGEKTHWSGAPERWYFVEPEESIPGVVTAPITIPCSRNSIRPRKRRSRPKPSVAGKDN